MTVVRHWPGLVLAGLFGVLAAGCAPDGVPEAEDGNVLAECRVLKNGLPVRPTGENLPPGDPGLKVVFVKLGSADAGKEMTASLADEEEGTFGLVGPEGKGIPPGKYRVVLFLGPEGGEDQFKGKYGRENSPIEVEVEEGKDVVIDLANYDAK